MFHPAQDTGYHILLLNAMIIKELSGVETILIKEIFISYSKNVEIGSKNKDSK